MDKRDMASIILYMVIVWMIIITVLFCLADYNANEMDLTDTTRSEITGVLFYAYLVQAIQGVYYLTVPIILFIIACTMLKEKKIM